MKTSKRPQLIEKVQEAPLYVIKDVFESDPRQLFYVLKNWLYIAVTTDHYAYDAPEQRSGLLAFYEALQRLIAALDILNSGATDKHCITYYNADNNFDKYYLLTGEQAANPKHVIAAFFKQFSIQHVRRELSDWLEAGIDFEGSFPISISPTHIYLVYKDVLCLVEAAYHLTCSM